MDVIGRSMTYGEAIRLVTVLARDPSSALGAAFAGLVHPVDRAVIVAADLVDLMARANSSKRPKPYPRTWVPNKDRRKFGRAAMSQAQVRATLAAAREGRLSLPSGASTST